MMFLEVFVETRLNCVPNFEQDQITAIYYTIHNESAEHDL